MTKKPKIKEKYTAVLWRNSKGVPLTKKEEKEVLKLLKSAGISEAEAYSK